MAALPGDRRGAGRPWDFFLCLSFTLNLPSVFPPTFPTVCFTYFILFPHYWFICFSHTCLSAENKTKRSHLYAFLTWLHVILLCVHTFTYILIHVFNRYLLLSAICVAGRHGPQLWAHSSTQTDSDPSQDGAHGQQGKQVVI